MKIQGRQEVKDSTSSSDEKGDCIGVLSKKAKENECLKGEQAIRTAMYEGQVELRIEL